MTDDLRRALRELPPRLEVPDDFFERVMATARRRRRTRWAASATAAVVVAVVGVVLAITASGGPSTARLTPIAPSTTPSTPPVSPSPSASGASSAAGLSFVPVSVSFVTPDLGWAYGPDRPTSSQGPGAFVGEVAVTHDGGRHWTALPRPGVNYFTSGGATSVRFVDSNRGYLYGDGLFETTDGGSHWRRLAAPGPINGLAVAKDTLSVMAMTCPASTPLCGRYDLYTGGLDGTGYVRAGSVTDTSNAQLTTFGTRVLVLWSPAVTAGPAHLSISTAADGTWSNFTTPCMALGSDSGSIAPFGDAGVALVCGGRPSAGKQPKAAYVSNDSGATWTLRGSALPATGNVGSLGAAEANTWVLAEKRGTLLVTHDGGSTWREAGIDGLAHGVDGWSQVVFTDPEHAVAVPDGVYASGIVLSDSGGDTWSSVSFPP